MAVLAETQMQLAEQVTANTAQGRELFAGALRHLLNFHHEAAIADFTKASQRDAGVAPMARWGIAAALGTHYNFTPGLGKSLRRPVFTSVIRFWLRVRV